MASAVRERLFAVAGAAFARDGFEPASLNAILLEAGVGKSTFFYYFVDKEDLFASVLEAKMARIAKAVEPIALPDSRKRFWAETTALLERWAHAAASEPDFLPLQRALQPLRRAPSPRLAEVMRDVVAVYRRVLERGVELGLVRSDLPLDTLVALTEAVDLVFDDLLHRNAAPTAAALDAHRARVFDTVRRLLRP